MEKTAKEILSTVLRTAEDVENEIGGEFKVYTEDKILQTYELSKVNNDIFYYEWYGDRITDSENQIRELKTKKKRLIKLFKITDDFLIDTKEGFYEVKFLDSTCIKVKDLIKHHGPDVRCFPRRDYALLLPCFWEYHQYKFLEKYESEMGRETFLSQMIRLKAAIDIVSINDSFYWDNNSMAALYEEKQKQELQAELDEESELGAVD